MPVWDPFTSNSCSSSLETGKETKTTTVATTVPTDSAKEDVTRKLATAFEYHRASEQTAARRKGILPVPVFSSYRSQTCNITMHTSQGKAKRQRQSFHKKEKI